MTEPIESKLTELKAEVAPIVDQANNLPMATIEDASEAATLMNDISRKKKSVEEQRKFFTGPLNDQVRKINQLFKGITGPLDDAEKILKERLLEFKQSQETETIIAGAVEVNTWTYEIEDETKVPAEYHCIDHMKISGVIKAGVRDIPGVRIYQQKTIRNR